MDYLIYQNKNKENDFDKIVFESDIMIKNVINEKNKITVTYIDKSNKKDFTYTYEFKKENGLC